MRADSDFLSSYILQKDRAFVFFRLPGSDTVQVYYLDTPAKNTPPVGKDVFVLSRFDVFRSGSPYFFPVRESFSFPLSAFRLPWSLAALGQDTYSGTPYSKTLFCNNVQRAVDAMNAGLFHKVVLSRPCWQEGVSAKEAGDIFRELSLAYPLSFVCLFSDPELGCWITASPELLLRRQGSTLQTVSLAGTRVHRAEPEAWGAKELAEQQWVTDYIRDVLDINGVYDLVMDGPETLRLGHIEHLRTRFSGKLAPGKDILPVLKTLHPTPAVGGLPKEESAAFIESAEAYDRQLYSGFFGPLYADGRAELFVQLRTARVYTNGILYFTGAGITAGSRPEAEWEETENKYRILARFL